MTNINVAVIIEKDADGFYAYAPDLQGCYTQGDTYEEALANIRDVVEMHVEDRLESGEALPNPSAITITNFEVSVGA
jgi:predicted RNase H-like HicB family nuclease